MIGHFKTLIKKLHSRKSALNAHFRELISIALCKTKTQLPDKGQLIFLAASPGIPLDPVRLIRQYSFRIQNNDNVIFFLRTVRDSYLDPQTHATHGVDLREFPNCSNLISLLLYSNHMGDGSPALGSVALTTQCITIALCRGR